MGYSEQDGVHRPQGDAAGTAEPGGERSLHRRLGRDLQRPAGICVEAAPAFAPAQCPLPARRRHNDRAWRFAVHVRDRRRFGYLARHSRRAGGRAAARHGHARNARPHAEPADPRAATDEARARGARAAGSVKRREPPGQWIAAILASTSDFTRPKSSLSRWKRWKRSAITPSWLR